MKLQSFKIIILVWFLLDASLSLAICDQTLSVGADVALAISNAASGSTICLNSGDYGSITLSGISKSISVTLQSITGSGATIGIIINKSNQLTFQNLTLSEFTWSGNENTNIKVLKNIFIGQMSVYGNGNGSPQHNVIDGNTFDGINSCDTCYEGRLQIYGGNDLIVSNNHFGKNGDSDGIQMGGYGTTIGPGNIFEDIIYLGSRHIDAIQLYGEVDHQTITGNYFRRNSDSIMAPDGGNAVTITKNVFEGGLDYPQIITGSQSNITIVHNTILNSMITVDAKSGSSASSNALVQDNIVLNGEFKVVCTNCVFNHNLFNSGSIPYGTNNIFGTPTFAGGATLTKYTDYLLTQGSVGYKAATDGLDMGGVLINTTTTVQLAAPLNLRVIN
ncbi:MAG: hypothetical protein ACXVCP_19535 [Bdellovibrio sp.]